ncbi:hypothetical protein B0H13DRAFT_2400983 [Mycena leptocephala]|nr:hypothetical protein B0H13DRAFT_2400983 [Mycena leptocephala]
MTPKFRWSDPQGDRTLTKIVKEQIPQWKNGLYPSQHNLVRRILDGQNILCCMATGGGKSALFAVPIIVLREMARNRHLYPDLPSRALPQGIVVTPTKGLASNIVLELGKLRIPAFAYCHETVTAARKAGRNLVNEIRECKTWNVICVDPEHLRDKAWREITAFDLFRANIVYGCVDEAHLINEWGVSFRPDFRHVGAFFGGRLPSFTSIMALSATLQPGSATNSMADSRGKSARLVAKRKAKNASSAQKSSPDGSTEAGDRTYSPDAKSVVEVSPVLSKPPRKRGRAQSVEILSDSDVESPPPKKSKSKQAKKTKEAVQLDPDRKLVLMIPQASSEGTQRENLKHSTTFDEALVVIHETIGCNDVPKKPLLSYKLSNAPAKAPAINLGSSSDWEGCLEEVTEAESKKNAKVSVVIIVVDIYMNSLRAKLGLKSAGAKPKKGKLPILDLEHAGSGDDDFDEGLGIMDKEVKCLEQLQNHHGRCQRCGPHCRVKSIARETTTSSPTPAAWLGAITRRRPTTAASEQPPFLGWDSTWGTRSCHRGQCKHRQLQVFFQCTCYPLAGCLSSLPRLSCINIYSTRLPSSDPPDMGALNPYTEIPEFIQQLNEYCPQRNLVQYIDRFGDLDFYNIDEIAKLGSADRLVELVGITHGNAQFLLDKIKAEMKRTDRAARN